MQTLKTVGKRFLLFVSVLCIFTSPAAFTPSVFLSFALLLVAAVLGAYGQIYFALTLVVLSLVAIMISPIFDILITGIDYAMIALVPLITACGGIVWGMYRSGKHV